jgi:hypothetical protein
VLFLGAWLVCGNAPPARAGDTGGVGRSLSADATIFRRAKPGDEWKTVAKNEGLVSGDLLIGLPGAAVESANRAVRLNFLADLDRLSPHPIREAAVILHANPKGDMKLTLDRGRIDLVNAKQKGPAQVRVFVRKEIWDVTLSDPGSTIALELYGRWPAGSTFTPTPGPKDVPHADLIFLVLKGEAVLKHENIEHTLSAPPGPALIGWDSLSGMDESPRRLDKLPAWAETKGGDSELAKKKKARLQRFHKMVLEKGIRATLEAMIQSDVEYDRELAVVALGAFDLLQPLAKALNDSKHPDIWEHAVEIMRHWIGRSPGQDQLLYQGLLKSGRYTPVDAETLCQLLHSFGENDLAQPATYQMLIDFLDHDKLGIRGLAYWHLVRLAPDGKEFGYNPSDPPAKREAAIKKWQKLIPKGKLPPKPRASKSDK